MQVKRIHMEDLQSLEEFLSTCGSSLDTFRYFSKRPLSSIKNHIVTLMGYDDNDIPVAYGHLDEEGGVVWLGICVAEMRQGEGYGSSMIEALLREAVSLGVGVINLSVNSDNLRGQRLYELYGFRLIKESGDVFFYCRTNDPESE